MPDYFLADFLMEITENDGIAWKTKPLKQIFEGKGASFQKLDRGGRRSTRKSDVLLR